jgi:hypothetical protein
VSLANRRMLLVIGFLACANLAVWAAKELLS